MKPERIAILKPSALGDIVHALPVLSALRERFPSARITWVVNRSYEPLLVDHPDLSETLSFDRGAFRRGVREALSYSVGFAAELRRRRFDLVIDLQGLLRTGLMCGFTGCPVRVGFADAREGSRHFYTHRVCVPAADELHAVERYWRVAEAVGAGGGAKRFVVPLRGEELAAVDADLADLPRPWLAVAAGARWATKRWPVEHFADIANRAHEAYGGSALIVGAKDDIPLSRMLASGLRGPHRDLTGRTALPRLAAVLARADAVLANDTGPLHLAAALGRPCVAPYTCTKAVRHGPFGFAAGAVETAVSCGGSYLRECPHGLRCFAELTPDRLWPPLAEVLTAWRTRTRSA